MGAVANGAQQPEPEQGGCDGLSILAAIQFGTGLGAELGRPDSIGRQVVARRSRQVLPGRRHVRAQRATADGETERRLLGDPRDLAHRQCADHAGRRLQRCRKAIQRLTEGGCRLRVERRHVRTGLFRAGKEEIRGRPRRRSVSDTDRRYRQRCERRHSLPQ